MTQLPEPGDIDNNNSRPFFNSNDPSNPSRRAGSANSNDNNRYSPYSFNGKTVIGIAIILAVSAVAAIAASATSSTPEIRNSGGGPSVLTMAASAQQQSSTTHVDKKFVLVAHNFGFNGTIGGPTIQVTKGDVVQITFINAGTMAHNFGMAKLSPQAMKIMEQTSGMPLDERMQKIPYDVMAQMPCPNCQPKFEEGHIETFVPPDAQVITTFTANETGHFTYFCQVRGHIWMGMMGDLIVVDNPSGISPGKHIAQSQGSVNG